MSYAISHNIEQYVNRPRLLQDDLRSRYDPSELEATIFTQGNISWK